jgi:hypothetical protein
MLLIYTPHISNRVKYIFKVYFEHLIPCTYKLAQNHMEFLAYEGPKLVYNMQSHEGLPSIYADGLLNENSIKQTEIIPKKSEYVIEFFQHTQKGFLFSFDVFASTFYLLSRYEEYLPFKRDIHGRFEAKESLAYKYDFLNKPVINIWAQSLKNKLLEAYPQLEFDSFTFKFISTIDIDNAFAYQEKGVMRNLGGFIKDLFRKDFKDLALRFRVLLRLKKDPFDTFQYLIELHKKLDVKCIFFMLLGDYGLNDKNIPSNNKNFRKLIKHLADYAQMGIHPSYGSNSKEGQLKKEINRLTEILHREIRHSRQHFLKLSLPETYLRLIEDEIEHDYTMGYSSLAGFRASCCTPFPWYNLEDEAITKLIIHPFAFMEGTFLYYQQKTKRHIIQEIHHLIDETKAVNGQFISIWHNDSVSDWKEWKGWKHIYEDMLHYIKEKK